MLIWSERPGPRLREVAADLATIAWLGLWVTIGLRLFDGLSQLAAAGRLIRDGGNNLLGAGGSVAGAVEGVPLVGEGAATSIRDAFGATARPVVQFGLDLERLLLIIAALLGVIVVAIAVVPWLNRYLPWRLERFRRLNAGVRVIRRGALLASEGGNRQLEELLASRALHRLDYADLLTFTPDPFGDWRSGKLDGLIQAELESIGLVRVARAREVSR